MDAVLRLSARYGALDARERVAVDAEVAAWVLSSDESLRFDGLSLIHDYEIRSAEPALRALTTRLEAESRPGAPYEWAKVNRLLARLSEDR